MVPELNPEAHQLWLLSIQILADLKQLVVVFQTRKIRSNLEGHILSYNEALYPIRNQVFWVSLGIHL